MRLIAILLAAGLAAIAVAPMLRVRVAKPDHRPRVALEMLARGAERQTRAAIAALAAGVAVAAVAIAAGQDGLWPIAGSLLAAAVVVGGIRLLAVRRRRALEAIDALAADRRGPAFRRLRHREARQLTQGALVFGAGGIALTVAGAAGLGEAGLVGGTAALSAAGALVVVAAGTRASG